VLQPTTTANATPGGGLDLALQRRVQAMFQRVLASWASDALSLQRRGLDRPGARGSGEGAVTPGGSPCSLPQPIYQDPPPIRWETGRPRHGRAAG
jgi:hypothetical protein